MLSTGRTVMSQAMLLSIDEPSTGLASHIQPDSFHVRNCLGIAMLLVGQNMRFAFNLSTGRTVWL